MAGLLLYDPDCGFCTRCATWLRRRGLACRIDAMSPDTLAALGIDADRAAREIPFVDDDGSVTFGARAVGEALSTGAHHLRVVGWLLMRSPILWLADPVYRWVAEHRHQLPGGSASCRLDQRPT